MTTQQHGDTDMSGSDEVAGAEAALSVDDQVRLRNIVASAGFEGHDVDVAERARLVELIAGRLSPDAARAQVLASIPAAALRRPST